MKQTRISVAVVVLAMVLAMVGCSGPTREQREQADQTMERIRQDRGYKEMLAMADSLEGLGWLSAAKALYWRGYASDRLKQYDQAADYWKQAMEAADVSRSKEDGEIYARAASRLANLLCVRGDYEGTLKVAVPVAKRLEEEKRDTTSDYENLLIYIGCCQAVLGESIQEAENNFERAYKNHLDNVERNHSDEAYKNAIAGLINIAYYCVTAKDYKNALYYTRNFGQLLGEYEQRPDASPVYIDRQLGRYDIYKAQALRGLGRQEEADEVFETYQQTDFSKTPEGQSLAEDYQAAATATEEAES